MVAQVRDMPARGCSQVAVKRVGHGVAFRREARPVVLRVAARAPRRLTVRVGVAPALLGFLLRRVDVAEDLEQVVLIIVVLSSGPESVAWSLVVGLLGPQDRP